MIPVSPELRAAIDSPSRRPTLRVVLTLGGTDYTFESGADQDMITGYSLSRTPEEQAIRASQISGTIAAQCTFTLQGWKPTVTGTFLSSSDLSIYKAAFTALRDNDYGIDAQVKVYQGYRTPEVELVQVFTGFVDGINVNDDESVAFRCLDGAGRMQGVTSLGRWVDYPTSGGNSEIFAKVVDVDVAEHLLARSGLATSLGPNPLGNCVVARRGYSIPEIGQQISPAGRFNRIRMTQSFTPKVGDVVVLEFSLFEKSTTLLTKSFTIGPIQIRRTHEGGVYWWDVSTIIDGEEVVTEPLSSTGWDLGTGREMYRYIEVEILQNGTRLFVHTRDASIPSRSYTNEMTSAVSLIGGEASSFTGGPYPFMAGTGADDIFQVYDGSALTPPFPRQMHGLSVRLERSGQFERVIRPDWERVAFSHDFADAPESHPPVSAVPEKQGSAWELLREVADAFGAHVRWDEQGGLVWTTRDQLAARRFAPPTITADGSRALLTSGFAYEARSRLASVSTSWVQYVTKSYETESAPLWSATEIVTVPANQTMELFVAVDMIVINIAQADSGPYDSTFQDSTYTAVRASQVGDPAAEVVRLGTILGTATAGGFTLYIRNPKPFEVAFWDPVTMAPRLEIRGEVLELSELTSRHTATASARGREALDLGQNEWRQDESFAKIQADAIAAEAALPAVVFSAQQTVGDPSRTIGDIISIHAGELMDEPIPCVIIGKDSDLTEDTLTVVPVVPPTGWVLGYTGRSELGADSTTTTCIIVA